MVVTGSQMFKLPTEGKLPVIRNKRHVRHCVITIKKTKLLLSFQT